jgi:hypothetical protein
VDAWRSVSGISWSDDILAVFAEFSRDVYFVLGLTLVEHVIRSRSARI